MTGVSAREPEPRSLPVMLADDPCEAAFGSVDPTGPSKYYRARYYDPRAGRFLSEDPIRFRGGINFYAYVGNNPVNRSDPFGLQACCSSGGSGSYADCWSRCVQKGLGNAANYLVGLGLAGAGYAIGSSPVTMMGTTLPAGEAAGMVAGATAGVLAGGTTQAGVTGAAIGSAIGSGAVTAAGIAGAAGAGYAIGTMGYCAYQCSQNTCFEYP